MNDRAEQVADRIYEAHQSDFDEIFLIDDNDQRVQAIVDMMFPDLLEAISVEFKDLT